jgi:hypothetical protein
MTGLVAGRRFSLASSKRVIGLDKGIFIRQNDKRQGKSMTMVNGQRRLAALQS